MAISDRKERERQEMMHRIKDAALELFRKEGYEHVTIRRLAENIDYSPGTIYLYYKSKDDIYYTLLKEGFEKLTEHQLTVQYIEDPIERLVAHGRAYVDFALAHRGYYEIMFVMKGPLKYMKAEGDSEATSSSYDILRMNVREAMEAGYFPNENPEIVSFALWSIVHGASSLLMSEHLDSMPKEAAESLANGFKDILGRLLIRNK